MKVLKDIWDYIKVFLVAIVLATLISTQVFTFSQVQQRSMENTLVEKDIIFIEKVTFNFKNPSRGDIIVLLEDSEVNNTFFGKIKRLYVDMYNKFLHIENQSRLVKRVVGVPGDNIDLIDGKVFINGEIFNELYVTSETYPRFIEFPITVAENEFFVLGDNRQVSQDSRDFGSIQKKQIEGKAIFRILPMRKIGKLR